MKGTPTFELRPDPAVLHIVRVGVEYPPDATPDAPLPGQGEPAFLEHVTATGRVRTVATHRGFRLPWPTGGGDVLLYYRDAAKRTMLAWVSRDGLGVPSVVDDLPEWPPWEVGDVKAWPVEGEAIGPVADPAAAVQRIREIVAPTVLDHEDALQQVYGALLAAGASFLGQIEGDG